MRAHSSYFRRKNSKKGLALSTTMAICIVLTILVALLVSIASLNINTTQATISQRSAYVQAKSAISFAESYYSQNSTAIPGSGGTGEGLIVFKSDKVADGAIFYETKKGLNEMIDATTVSDLKTNCKNTYIEVANAKTSTGVSKLTLNAVCKYGDGNAYTLAKEYSVGGVGDAKDNAFTGSINYQTTNFTRYVRFHVHATTAFDSAPFFYMWYNQISPAKDSGKSGVYNAYAESSIVNKLTWNDAYSKVQNGSWDDSGPAGDCAMSYEGNGWWVTQKTFNLDRNLHFVNGIITRGNGVRDGGDDQQSWEFFGIPIPAENELGAQNGVDIYFEVNQNNLKDMKGQRSDGKDFFSDTYNKSPGTSGDGGKKQLDNFVKYCSEWYTVYTKTDTAIVHYRETGATEDHVVNSEGNALDSNGNVTNNSSQFVSTGIGGFAYEGYGWWRDWTHDFDKTLSVGSASYRYGSGGVISQNQYGKERLLELFVCYDPSTGDSASFAEEEDANEWFVKHGDLSAGDYVEVNVKAVGQPVDKNEAPTTTIQYSAEIFKDDVKVPRAPKADDGNTLPTSAEEVPDPTKIGLADDTVEYKKLTENSFGDFYLVGSMNNWQENVTWNNLADQLNNDGDNQYSIEYDVTPNQEVKFWIVQKPSRITYFYYNNQQHKRNLNDVYDTYKGIYGYWYDKGQWVSNYTNYWGTGSSDDDYRTSFVPQSNKIKIVFTSTNAGESIDVYDIGEKPTTSSAYSVVGWMNDWGKKQDGQTTETEHGRYELTRDMEMYADVDDIMTYSDGSLVVQTGQEYHFKIAERDVNTTEGDIDWTKVYGVDGTVTGVEGDDDSSVVIKPYDPGDGKVHKYLVTITLTLTEDGKKIPSFETVETTNVDTFYLAGEFNGWSTDEAADFEFDNLQGFQLEEQGADQNDIVYTYKINSLLEAQTYEFRVIGSSAKTPEGLVNYEFSWGDKISSNPEDEKYLVTQGADAPAKTDPLSERAYITVIFTYHKNDPSKSEITFEHGKAPDNLQAEGVWVGFHNDKLENVNDHKKDSKFTEKWEKVYVTYYTKETGSNCFEAEVADDGINWWAKVPNDAEYCYFSNKKTSIYKQLHSSDFEYTDNIPASKFKGSKSTIFFPIIPVKDSEERTRWTVGDSQDYNMYVNERKKIEHRTETMAYYGSTQCNYYDAPIVNVLNMLASGSPSPSQKWAFAAYPYTGWKVNNKNYLSVPNFQTTPGRKTLSYQGETYYAVPCSINASSFLIVQNAKSTGGGKNNATMTGYMFEGDMSLKENDGDWRTTISEGTYITKELVNNGFYISINTYNVGDHLYMWDRAGGVFVSDETYRDGSQSFFNYGGYTPSWYTFRIPVTSTVTIENVTGVVTSATKVVDNNTKEFEVVRESPNVNRDVYIYKPGSGDTQSYSYNIDRGVVDGIAESYTTDVWVNGKKKQVRHLTGKVTVSAYFENSEGWSNVYVHAYSPIGKETYAPLSVDNTASGSDNKGYYVFPFDQGTYSFFQFYEAPSKDADGNNISNKASKQALEAAEHKSSVLYFTGEELGSTGDRYTDEFGGLDTRTTKILARGSATGFTWYMHPRIKVMHAYLDLDSVVQLTKIPKRYLYNPTQGTYTYYNNEILEMTALASEESGLESSYYSSGPWSADSISDYSGLLEAATEFMDAVREARIYVSDDVTKAKTDTNPNNWESGYWRGDDPTHQMVFMEGEQIQNGIFEYTDRWTSGLKDLIKRYTLESGSEFVWGNNKARQNAQTLSQYAANLRLWLDNPQATIKETAVTITVDDTPKDGLGGWGKENIHLYVKNKTTGEWSQYTSEILTTTQPNFYAFAFDFPDENDPAAANYNMYNGCEFTIARDKAPDENSMIDGMTVKTCVLYAGGRFRYNTYKPIGSSDSFDEDLSQETKTYNGTEIIDGENSPTAKLNVWNGMKLGREFVLNFKYDTHIQGGGVDYTIYAGAYTINETTYPNFYKDLGSATYEEAKANNRGSGIDLFTTGAKDFFQNPNTYGMHSAKGYSEWRTNKDNSSKDVDIMTNAITKNGSISASASKNIVSFRYNGAKGSDTLKIDRNISLSGAEVTIAANVLDFRGSGSNDFTLKSKTINFMTDTVVKTDSETVTISHGTYVFNAKDESDRVINASLKGTNNSGTDWRSRYVLTNGQGSKLGGGKYVAK